MASDAPSDRPVALVTGTTSGIGLALAEGLAEKGFRVVMHARTEERGERALEAVRARSRSRDVDLIAGDLAIQDEIRTMAQRFLARFDRLDVLIHNAGIYRPRRHETPDGIEETFAVNHLAPFLLTRLLMERLEETGRAHGTARVVTVASSAHQVAWLHPDDLERTHHYRGWQQYANTKLMNILWTRALAKRMDPYLVTANAYHPGVVRTRLGRASGIIDRLFQMVGFPPEKGADTGLWLATDPSLGGQTGGYYGRRRRAWTTPVARDEALAERLWVLSEAYAR